MTTHENLSAKRLLTGLAATLLVAGCATSTRPERHRRLPPRPLRPRW